MYTDGNMEYRSSFGRTWLDSVSVNSIGYRENTIVLEVCCVFRCIPISLSLVEERRQVYSNDRARNKGLKYAVCLVDGLAMCMWNNPAALFYRTT